MMFGSAHKMLDSARVLMRRLAALLLGVMVPRPMQQEAYDKLVHARLRRLHSPTGSGKTLLIQTIAMTEMVFEAGRRTLIAVPQMNIGRGFKARRVWLPRREWTVPVFLAAFVVCAALLFWHRWCLLAPPLLWLLWRRLATRFWEAENLCDGDSDDRVARVEAFIRGGRGTMVCCHASLARAWRRVGSAGRVRDMSLWIDEAHYVKAGGERNGVGEMVHMLVRGDESVRIGLATATPCRGDRRDIVHPDDADEFVVYDGPFDRHFEENMPSVESVEFDYVPYSPTAGWAGELVEWIRRRGPKESRRSLIYVPHPGSILSSPDSPDGTPGKIVDLKTVLAAVGEADPGAEVVDLVTDRANGGDNSEEMKALEERIAAGDDPDYVVALNLMKVGSDWPNLRTVIDLAPGASRPESGQKFGRLAREPFRGADKRTITYASFFPMLGCRMNERLRRACSERLASLISLLLLHYAAEAAAIFRRARSRTGVSGTRTERSNPAMDQAWLEGFLVTLASREGGAEHATCVEVARALMDEMDIPEEFRSGLEHIVRHLNRRPSDRTVSALVDAGFDEVGYGELGAMMILTTGERAGDGLFEKFRVVTRGMVLKEERVVEAIRARMESELGWKPYSYDATQIPGLPEGITCKLLASAIKQCHRGFVRENDTLAKMLRRHGLLPPKPPPLTEEQVVGAIRARMESEPDWTPSMGDGTQMPGLPDGTTCKLIDTAIRKRIRGFEREDDSLPRMLRRHGIRSGKPKS